MSPQQLGIFAYEVADTALEGCYATEMKTLDAQMKIEIDFSLALRMCVLVRTARKYGKN